MYKNLISEAVSYIKQNILTLLISFSLISLTLKESINSISLGLLLIYSFFIQVKGKEKISLKIYYPFYILFFLFTFNLLFFDSIEAKNMGKYLLRFLPFLLIPLTFSFLKIDNKKILHIQIIFFIWILLNAIYSHLIILSRLISDGNDLSLLFRKDYSYIELSHTIGLDSTYYSYFVLLSIIIGFHLIFKEIKMIYKLGIGILIIYLSFFIIHLSSRMIIIALLGVILFYIFYYFFLRKKIILGVLSIIVSLILLSAIVYNVRATRYRFQQIIGFTFSNGAQHQDGINKLKQFEASIDANNDFLFGNGIANANNSIINSYLNHDLKHFAENEYNSHNQYIQTYVGVGLIGLIALIYLLGYFSFIFFKYRNINGFLFLLLSSFLFLTEAYLERHNGIVLLTLYTCMNVNFLIQSTKIHSNHINKAPFNKLDNQCRTD